MALAALVAGCSGSTERSPAGALGTVPVSAAGGGASAAGTSGAASMDATSGAAGTSAGQGFGGQPVTATGGSASAGEAMSAAGAAGSPPMVNLIGTGCWPPGSLGCNGKNQRQQLVCVGDAFSTWQAAGECGENERCDNTEHVGACAPLLAECMGQEPYRGMCLGDTYLECGVDLVTIAYQELCTERCVASPTGADCIQTGCGDGSVSASEACDDGNNENADGCSAACVWEPPEGRVATHAMYFGSPAVISGDTIVAYAADDRDSAKQSLYVFRGRGPIWTLEARLAAAPGGYFGGALALDGDTLAVSGDDDLGPAGAGAVFIYRRTGSAWALQEELVATRPDGTSERADSQSFGSSLGLNGDSLAVGAIGDDNQGSFSGAVYVFQRTGDTFMAQAKLVAEQPAAALDGTSSGQFGNSVTLSGDTLVVGALAARGDDGLQGAAYIFQRSGTTWAPEARLRATLPGGASDVGETDQFGWSVALQDDLLVVGSRYDNDYSGTAYVFRHKGSTWTPEAHLVPPADTAGEESSIAEFGDTVGISGSGKVIAVGSPRDKVPGAYAGSIHVFTQEGDTWAWQTQLLAKPPRGVFVEGAESAFGGSLDLDGERILTGAYNAEGAGRAYLFEPKGSGWQTRLELQALEP